MRSFVCFCLFLIVAASFAVFVTELFAAFLLFFFFFFSWGGGWGGGVREVDFFSDYQVAPLKCIFGQLAISD